MRGVVFVEFIKFIDKMVGLVETENIITEAKLPSEGAYTSTGDYSHQEIHQLIEVIKNRSGLSEEELQEAFGKFLFGQFIEKYDRILSKYNNTFDLMKNINEEIHLEAKKIYPHTKYPKFDYENQSENRIRLIYSSNRNMPFMAKGMILASIDHFQENIQLETHPLNNENNEYEFVLTQIEE